jgi:peptide/nickel transport system permease protein
MIRYVLGRLVQALPVLFGISVIIFLLARLIPGNPAVAVLGTKATPELVARVRDLLGLDRPIWEQYLTYLSHALTGDLGVSFFYGQDVLPLVFDRLPVTLALIAYAAIFAVLMAVPLATITAVKRDGAVDHAIRLLFSTTLGIPSFWLGLMLALVLGARLRIFPVAGLGDGGLNTIWHLTLPALTIGLAVMPILGRSLRSSIIEVLQSDFVVCGRAAGLPQGVLMRSYVIRNSLIPAVTVLSAHIGWLIGGTVIVERVFGIPGVGSLLINSITNRDYAIIQAVALILAFLVVMINIATDVIYAALDPRISLK